MPALARRALALYAFAPLQEIQPKHLNHSAGPFHRHKLGTVGPLSHVDRIETADLGPSGDLDGHTFRHAELIVYCRRGGLESKAFHFERSSMRHYGSECRLWEPEI